MAAQLTESYGESFLDGAIVAQAVANGFVVGLFKNDYTPIVTSGLGDLTEADFAGYAEVSAPTWDPSAYDGGDQTVKTQAPDAVFTSSDPTPQDIYGAFIADGGGNLVCAARHPSAPITMNNLDTFTVSLNGTLGPIV